MRTWQKVALAALALVMSTVSAEARRRIPLFFTVPGLSSSETVVKVLDFPDSAPFQRPDGRFVDLGYHFMKDGSGAWCGYLGSSSEYLTLDDDQVDILLAAAGIFERPAVPERSTFSGAGTGQGFWLIVGAVILVGFIGKMLVGATTATARSVTKLAHTVEPSSHEAQDWTKRAETKLGIANATSGIARVGAYSREAPRATTKLASRTDGIAGATRAGFGRR